MSMKFYWSTATPTHLHAIYGYFHRRAEEVGAPFPHYIFFYLSTFLIKLIHVDFNHIFKYLS